MKSDEEIPTADSEQIERLIERVKQGKLEQNDAQLIEKLLRTFLTLTSLLQRKNTTIKRLKQMFLGPEKQGKDKSDISAGTPAGSQEENTEGDSSNEKASSLRPEGEPVSGKSSKPGHGRKPASAYTGARIVRLLHPNLSAGGRCPDPTCEGRLHKLEKPKTKIYLTGQPLISATKFERPILRCSDCFERYVAGLPEGVKEDEKFDATADVAIALSKYGCGLPFYRQARMQESCGVPLPESVQYERCEEVAKAALPVYLHLGKLAANGKVFHIDDTRVRILSCFQEDKHRSEKERRATHTSGIVVLDDEGYKIALYLSGRQHAGENLDEILKTRNSLLPPPIKMSDAAAVNGKMEIGTIECNCLTHGRGKFIEIEEIFPAESRKVLDAIGRVYDFEAKTKGMSDEDRLAYHQKYSRPVMSQLQAWIEEQFRERQVEPNSALGKAFQYLLNHYEKLTRFITIPGAPIDNNQAERVLKRFVLFRKNSLFYKTENGAAVGGVLLSLIESCRLNQTNPWEYLLTLMQNREEARRDPATYLPWNYRRSEEEELESRAA